MKHFKDSDFECKCGHCGLGIDDMEPELMDKLQVARELAEAPFTINSAVRCEFWNDKQGGSLKSSHMSGFALDIKCDRSYPRFRMFKAILDAGFKRIGVRKDFIHVDVDPNKDEEVLWTY